MDRFEFRVQRQFFIDDLWSGQKAATASPLSSRGLTEEEMLVSDSFRALTIMAVTLEPATCFATAQNVLPRLGINLSLWT